MQQQYLHGNTNDNADSNVDDDGDASSIATTTTTATTTISTPTTTTITAHDGDDDGDSDNADAETDRIAENCSPSSITLTKFMLWKQLDESSPEKAKMDCRATKSGSGNFYRV